MSTPLPRDGENFRAWLAKNADHDPNRKLGQSWRAKVLGYKRLVDLMAELPPRRNVMFNLPADEISVVAKHVVRSGMSRNRWLRMAVGYYLVHVCGEDRARIPKLTEDL